MATSYIYRTPGVEGNLKKWTFSFWIKHCDVATTMGEHQTLFNQATSGSNYTQVHIKTGQQIYFIQESSGDEDKLITDRVFRDPTAWYHIVAVWDTAASETDRMILYVNGVRETSFASEVYPSLNKDSFVGITSDPLGIGASEYTGSFINEFDGVMSNVQYADGYAYAASDFGEFDSTSGIWKIKTAAVADYGTNGFYMKMQDRTNLDLDSSPNGLTMTTSGTITGTYDNPDNNFSTLCPLYMPMSAEPTLSNGNNVVVTQNASGKYFGSASSIGMTSGLWYAEFELTDATTEGVVGISETPGYDAYDSRWIGEGADDWGYASSDGNMYNNNAGTSFGDTYTTGDIIGVYLDLDAYKMYWAKNGTLQDSGTGKSLTAGLTYFFSCSDFSTAASTWSTNFGNGFFGTTAVSSAVADEGGIGAFEYDPSAGSFDSSSKDFRALCTKNMATYGG